MNFTAKPVRTSSLRNLSLAIFFSLTGLCAQVQVIPQVADGGGWATTIVLTNTTAIAQTVRLTFNQSTGATGATTPWIPPFKENITLSAIGLPAGSTRFIHTAGTAATLTQGWGQLTAADGVEGYAIFTSQAPGNPAQDATAPAGAAASRILVPFDNTSHLITAVAVVNPNAAPEAIQVNIKTSDGDVSTGTATLPANGQTTFLMPAQFPTTAGKSGLAEFFANSGTIASIALRANPSGAFTAAPVYAQSGAPVITASSQPAAGRFIAAAQKQIIPQVADGDGWKSTIILVNTSATTQMVTLKFYERFASNGATTIWNPPFNESVSLTSLSLPAASALFLHTAGTAETLSQGWGELNADPAVVGYAIFTSAAPGNPAQDATAPAGPAASRILIPFDNTSGFQAAIAAANTHTAAETINVTIRTTDNVISTGTLQSLPASGQAAFLIPVQFPETAGKSGLAEFYVPSGVFSMIALRANPSGAFTAAPVYFASGAPVIPTGGPVFSGSFVVSRITSSSLLFPGPTVEFDTITGAFSRYSQAAYDIVQGTLHIGACAISDYTYDLSSEPAPNAPDALLDAGSSVAVTGPNLPPHSALASFPSPTGPAYSLTLAPGTLDNGIYTLTGTGGADIGLFSVAGLFPQSFAVNKWASYTAINRSAPLNISWTGAGFTNVNVILSSVITTGASTHTVLISCSVPANPPSFTVSTDILSHLLPVSGGGTSTGLGSFQVSANSQVNFNATRVQTGANIDHGVLQLLRGYAVSLPIN